MKITDKIRLDHLLARIKSAGDNGIYRGYELITTRARVDADIRARGKADKPCEAVLFCGPGHQSRFRCERKSKHIQHWNTDGGYFWTKQECSGSMDDSPEEQNFDAAIRAGERNKI